MWKFINISATKIFRGINFVWPLKSSDFYTTTLNWFHVNVSSRTFLEFPHCEYVSFLWSSTYLHTLVFMACLLFEWLMAKFIGWSVHQKIYDHCPKDSLLTTLFLVKEFFPLIGFQRCCSVLLSDLLLTVATFISSMERSSFFLELKKKHPKYFQEMSIPLFSVSFVHILVQEWICLNFQFPYLKSGKNDHFLEKLAKVFTWSFECRIEAIK